MNLLVMVEKFQSLIVGIIGFTGVIFTLWFNAWQTRKQRFDERRNECETLRAALIAELSIIRESLVRNTEIVDEEKAAFVPTDPMDDAYRAFTNRIGLLSELEVRKVMFAYLTLRTYIAKLYLIGVPPHTGDRHVHVPAKNIGLLNNMQKRLIDPIEQAIQSMEHVRDR